MIRVMVTSESDNPWSRFFYSWIEGDFARGLRREGSLLHVWSAAAMSPARR